MRATTAHPAGATRQLLGVSDRRYQETIAEAIVGLGCERALVVCADDGLDELSISDRTRVVEVAGGGTEEWFVGPEDLDLELANLEQIAGGEPADNAAVVRGVLAGAPGPARDVVVLNAGAAIMAAGAADNLREGVERAKAAIDIGAATQVLDRLVALTAKLP